MPKVFEYVTTHAAMFLYAATITAKQIAPAFPHAHAALEAIGDTCFQLALLATDPSAALRALQATPKPTVTIRAGA
jgi:hypothetical protein